MNNYVVYHKAEKMGYPALDVKSLAVYTKKSANGTVGSRVWLIAGEKSPRKYYLRATFLIKSIGLSDKSDFNSLIVGTDGQLLDPMPLISDELWFAEFLKEQGNFAFGFNCIRNVHVIEALRKILIENTLR